MTSASDLVERVVAAIGRLALLGETIADEWTYVHDLETVWTARLRTVAASLTIAGSETDAGRLAETTDPGAASRAGALPGPELESAIDELIAEVDRITDPHRAIDWLSTLPQAALVALGEAAW
jgi:hypothetical protein